MKNILMSNIQLVHEGEDYIKVSYTDNDDTYKEVEITGIAIDIIKKLGEALHKESFLKKK